MILRNECTEDAASMVPNPIRWYQCSWWCFSAAAVANDKESSLERVGKIAIASKQARIGDWGAAAVPGRVANGSWRRVGRSPRKHRTESIFNCCETNERIMRPQRRGGESSNVAAAVRERLHSTVGLSPSMEWLKDCLSSLDETNNENRHHHHNNDKNVEALAMDVLQQVLVHDLRDIVRTTTTTTLEDDDDTAPTTTNLATHSHQHMIAMLQRAVQSSLSPPYKATLPASFRLMVQVEEWVDVAKNAAARLEETTTTTTKRCFKISYSHGSPPESTPLAGRDENSPNNAPLVAMELAPLIGCSTISAAAGLKVVLVGPLTVRHGMAGWTPANALILGGAVERLAAARRHAVQRARAGHGVDPTVQALIWTANTVPDDDETGGEADRASTDVAPAAMPMLTNNSASSISRIVPIITTSNPAAQSRPRVSQQQQHPRTIAASTATVAPGRILLRSSSSSEEARHCRDDETMESQPRRNPYHSNNNTVVASNVSSNSSSTVLQSRAFATASSLLPSSSSIPSSNNPYQPPSPPPPVGGGLSSAQLPQPLSPASWPAAPVSRSSIPYQAAVQPPQTHLQPPNGRLLQFPTTTTTRHAEVTPSTSTAMSIERGGTTRTTATTDSGGPMAASPRPLSYRQLRTMLREAMILKAAYREAHAIVYSVQLRQQGVKLHFNIDKKRTSKEKTKGEKQYEYVMIAKFGGDCDTDGVVTCLVSSSILEPHFPISPGEMRKLSREDKAKADTLVRDGGKAVQHCLYQLSWYDVTLHRSLEDVYGSSTASVTSNPIDGNQPILYLLPSTVTR